ncbi:MAG: methyltransferase [Bacteroidales bacterium]|nr:methyltransferase [Bacteroidales bacterium]
MEITDNLKRAYGHDVKMRAIDAQRKAAEIAYGPVTFEVAHIMLKRGIFEMLSKASGGAAMSDSNSAKGLTLNEICAQTGSSRYAVKVLMESALTTGTVYRDNKKYFLSKIGWFLLNEERNRIDIAFNHDVNYQGWFNLETALEEEKPAGLKHFGSWPTIYEGLSKLPTNVQKSWFDFDHYYSDNSFDEALNIIFEGGANADCKKTSVKKLLDVGGNTGLFALQCVKKNPSVNVTIVDLPQQLEMMKKNVKAVCEKENINRHKVVSEGGTCECKPVDWEKRISGFGGNLLDASFKLPTGYDVIWMSQFLDCFSEEQVISILKRAAAAMSDKTRLYIMETIWDRQQFETTAFCLTQISLYFTALANGNSKMFNAEDLTHLIESAGLKIERVVDGIGPGKHSIVICKKI